MEKRNFHSRLLFIPQSQWAALKALLERGILERQIHRSSSGTRMISIRYSRAIDYNLALDGRQPIISTLLFTLLSVFILIVVHFSVLIT